LATGVGRTTTSTIAAREVAVAMTPLVAVVVEMCVGAHSWFG